MSVYSRWVEARGTTSILSSPACRQASYPVLRSRCGSGPLAEGDGVSDDPPLMVYGETVKPYSDCTPSAGTTGLLPVPSSGPAPAGPVSLSRATTAATRRSVVCTLETAAAPIEWPRMAIFVVRPGAFGWASAERSKNCQYGLKASTVAPSERGL